MPGIFVTATDTGAGKTYCSCLLLKKFQQMRLTAIGMKPVASGAVETESGLRNQDALLLRKASSDSNLPYADINPFLFSPAIAPHIAAEQAGIEINFDVIEARYNKLQKQSDWVVVEGVGGWQVPLSENKTLADLAMQLGLPVVMVVGMRLGCLNHALLTAESVRASGLKLAGWIANKIEKNFLAIEENISFLQKNLHAPCLGIVEWQEKSGDETNLQKITLESFLS